ncbi:coiled-coil domain-containing protein 102A-like isoform X1 [Octopus sinensis]|uniref:Coiled-coil domain-containing protein 102A n=1 Tax=Octopus sinensis TaxID=2607531 RepID=A0A6P7TCA0_9MOLL|nr:coiled-coil domain-containing protein 102A-like isoform X1 [Octopus sinensis]
MSQRSSSCAAHKISSSSSSGGGDVANIRATPSIPMSPTSGRERMSSASSTPLSFTQMAEYEWLEREELHMRELEEARSRTAQMEKTMRWWSDCTANWREKWSKVRNERNKALEENRTLRNKMDSFVKESADLKRDKQELLSEIEELKKRVEYCKGAGSSDIDPGIHGVGSSVEGGGCEEGAKNTNTTNNNNNNNNNDSETSRYDVKNREELAAATVTCKVSETPVENLIEKNELHVESSKASPSKCRQEEASESHISRIEDRLSLVTKKLDESQKTLHLQCEENIRLTKTIEKLEEEISSLKIKYDELKLSKASVINEMERLQAEHKEELSRIYLELEDEQENHLAVDKRMADLRKELEALQAENASEWAKRERLETEKLSLERESKKLRTKIDDLHEQLEQKNQQAATLIDSDMRTMQFELSEKNKEVIELRHVHAKLKKINVEKHTELDHTRRRAEQYEMEVKKLRSRIEELKQDLASAEDEADLQANNVRKLQRTNEEYEEQVGNLQVQIEHLQSRLRRGNPQTCLKSRSSQSLKSFTTDEATTLPDSDENAMEDDIS